ncbi:MAG: hypothetical protein ACREUU_10630 [Gammaproteobacteria bacterium]
MGNQYIYFFENGVFNGESIQWADGTVEDFVLSDDLKVKRWRGIRLQP